MADAVLKDDMATMEHPFYALSKKPDTRVRRYEQGDKWLEVVPSVQGLATIYDKDILIYCISQMIAKMNEGHSPSPYVRINAKDLLIFINRTTGGKDYEALKEALARLDGTRIRTNVRTGDMETHEGFGLIESYTLRRSERTGRILEFGVKLSDWVFRSIQAKEVLTLHRDYFRLRKPLEKRVYEIARKHCGRKERWEISLEVLRNKSGSTSTMKEFRRLLRSLAQGDHLPDYRVQMEGEKVTFINRETMPQERAGQGATDNTAFPGLDVETYHEARIVAPGWDVYELEQQWRGFWVDSGRPDLKNPDAAFIAFCRRRAERQLQP
ncbi:MAG: replication initiator protein A [Anaerolineae bacterium]|nr:replication initiator protein A [Anaerolineae bacterium]